MKKYKIIYADPPWRYARSKVQGAAEKHYPTMSIEELCALPVKEIADKDCILFLWATFPQLKEALQLIKAWGFTYKSVAFVWLKQNRKSPTWFYGLGFWTRGNAEICLLATKGHPKRQSKSRIYRGKRYLPLWATYRVLNCSQGSIPPVGTYGEMKSQATYGLPGRRFEMAYVTVPKDLTKIKSKVMFNLTKRQLICFGAAVAIGLPLFFLTKDSAGTTTAALCMVLAMLPMFLLAMYEKNGQPLEVIIRQFVEVKFLRPKERPYQTNNFYAALARQERLDKEVRAIVKGKGKDPKRKA